MSVSPRRSLIRSVYFLRSAVSAAFSCAYLRLPPGPEGLLDMHSAGLAPGIGAAAVRGRPNLPLWAGPLPLLPCVTPPFCPLVSEHTAPEPRQPGLLCSAGSSFIHVSLSGSGFCSFSVQLSMLLVWTPTSSVRTLGLG